MRAGRVQFTRGDRGPRKIMTLVLGIILTIVGFILWQPFFWVVVVGGHTYHYITLPVLAMIMGCIIGLPMFFAGIIGIMMRKSNASPSTYNDHDVGRIRHAVETDKMNRR